MDRDDMNIPEHVLRMTTKCRNNFSCLDNNQCGDRPKCTVQRVNGENVLFLSSSEHVDCPYRLAFGSRQICTCPTNFALNVKGR